MLHSPSVAYQAGGVSNTHLKFQSFDKAELNFQFCGKYICNNLIYEYGVHPFAN
jgi:hypothetical protein